MTPARGARKTTVCKTLARGARKTTVCKTLARKTTVCKMPVCKMPVCKTPARGVSTYRVRPSPGNVETPLAGVLCVGVLCVGVLCVGVLPLRWYALRTPLASQTPHSHRAA